MRRMENVRRRFEVETSARSIPVEVVSRRVEKYPRHICSRQRRQRLIDLRMEHNSAVWKRRGLDPKRRPEQEGQGMTCIMEEARLFGVSGVEKLDFGKQRIFPVDCAVGIEQALSVVTKLRSDRTQIARIGRNTSSRRDSEIEQLVQDGRSAMR